MLQLRVGKLRAGEVGIDERRLLGIHPEQDRAACPDPREIRLLQLGAAQIGTREIRVLQDRLLELRVGERGVREPRAGEVRVLQVARRRIALLALEGWREAG